MNPKRTRLQTTDEMPLDGPGEQLGFLAQLLQVVLAKMQLPNRRLMEGEDIIDRLELGDSYESDLESLLDAHA
jgi:hypothetical protein